MRLSAAPKTQTTELLVDTSRALFLHCDAGCQDYLRGQQAQTRAELIARQCAASEQILICHFEKLVARRKPANDFDPGFGDA
jgi:hypothetical protein